MHAQGRPLVGLEAVVNPEQVAGDIRPDPTAPGFKRILINSAIVGDLTWVKCSYDSNDGPIMSHWKREGSKLTTNVAIPPNITAEVFVPTEDQAGVTESGNPAGASTGVKFLRMENGAAVSVGTCQFQAALPQVGAK